MSSTREVAEKIIHDTASRFEREDVGLFVTAKFNVLAAEIDTALRQCEREVRAEGWLPIESAPRDGTEVLLGHGNSIWLDQWIISEDWEGGGYWMMCDQWDDPETPTNWMPAPPLPEPITIRRDSAQEGEQPK